jgi:dTDP-4-dehydrorhamnose 3,5-epimerase
MQFTETSLPGVWIITLDPIVDERGHFARTYCEREFAARGLCTTWVQMSTSYNRRAGTLRGMHYQAPPHEEIKLIRCTRGAVYDVAVDLRASSATRFQWTGITLSAANGLMLYVPKGVAHGFQTLEDESDLTYCISTAYEPSAACSVAWNSQQFDIPWPLVPPILSERDLFAPSLSHKEGR